MPQICSIHIDNEALVIYISLKVAQVHPIVT